MLFGWDMVAFGPEAVLICNVADRYGCSIWADVGVESLLHNHSLPVIVCVQQCALLADCGAILVRKPA